MPKSNKSKPVTGAMVATTLDLAAHTYALARFGSVSRGDTKLILHAISSGCHNLIGLEGQRSASIPELLLMVVHLAAIGGDDAARLLAQVVELWTVSEPAAGAAVKASERLSTEVAAGV